jgi:hypothetical protein
MLSTDGVTKILDLGLARVFSDHPSLGELTQSNQAIGTADYMAPEQWEDSRQVDIRADIYSLGCTLYKLLTGKPLFDNADYKPLPLKKIAHERLPFIPLLERRPDVPVDLVAVMDKMLAKRREGRFGTPQEAATALASFVSGCDCRRLMAAALERNQAVPDGNDSTPLVSSQTLGFRQRTPPMEMEKTTGQPIGMRRMVRWLLPAGICLLGAVAIVTFAWPGVWNGNAKNHDGPGGDKDPKTVSAHSKIGEQETSRGGDGPQEIVLLQQPPEKLLWVDNDPDFHHNPLLQTHALWVNTQAPAILGLDKADLPRYKIQLGIKQARWVGGCGIFFGCHPVTKPVVGYKLQYLQVKRDANIEKRSFYLGRGTIYIRQTDKGARTFFPHGFAQAELGNLQDGVSNTLVVDIKGSAVSIYWNSRPLPTLTVSKDISHCEPEDYLGKFGVYNDQSSTYYDNARLTIRERNE